MKRLLTVRLRFWLRCMRALELCHFTGTGLYFWCCRRAAACNDWRWP